MVYHTPPMRMAFCRGACDGGTVNLYMDGVFKTSYSDRALASKSGTLAIGSCANLLNCGQYFPGTIDDVRIYNTTARSGQMKSGSSTMPAANKLSALLPH